MKSDIIIIGGGASGLMAGYAAADALVEAGVQNCELHLYEGMEHAVIWFQSEQCTTNFLNWLDGIFGR